LYGKKREKIPQKIFKKKFKNHVPQGGQVRGPDPERYQLIAVPEESMLKGTFQQGSKFRTLLCA
jgi:hypothetical protein